MFWDSIEVIIKKIPGGQRLRSMETMILSRVGDDKESKAIVLELCACRDWGRECERSVEKKGILFCREKTPECVARGKERR
jgi:hypothetical protein